MGLQNLFQDNLNYKMGKQMKYLNKLLSYHKILDIFQHLPVLLPQDRLFGYEDFKKYLILYCLCINHIFASMKLCYNINLLRRAILNTKDCYVSYIVLILN